MVNFLLNRKYFGSGGCWDDRRVKGMDFLFGVVIDFGLFDEFGICYEVEF